MADKNPLEMSDDEISNMSAPPVASEPETDQQKADREAQEEADRVAAEEAAAAEEGLTDAEKAARAADADDGDGDDDDKGEDGDKPDGDGEVDPAKKVDDKPELDADGKPIEKKPEEKKPAEGKDPLGSKAKPDAKDSATELKIPDAAGLESFYKQVMAPFKANGKTIELKSEAEVISLMQMGANYTRKLQDIQPHRKMLLMLQNNGLLDEGKLSYLIDLDKKNPEAIKKLIKDSGIDPLDIDAADDTAYRVGDHSVTDAEADFRTTMGELVSSGPEGKATVAEIHDNWDDASKEVLWNQPAIMAIIHEAKQNGVYDLIKAEVDRRKTLGVVPANTPFLEAYKAVGDEMLAEVGIDPTAAPGKPKADVKRDVLTTRAAAPKSKLANGDKASSASPTKASSKAAKEVVNPLAMKDEDFLKQMEGRV